MVSRGSGRGNRELLFNGHGVSVWETFLVTDGGTAV